MPTVLIVGVFGNSMTILTMSSKSLSDLTSRYILIALACSDTMLIILQPFNKLFVRNLFGSDARAISDDGCKIFFWLFRTSKMTSSWLIVILCFERFVAVVFPLKAKRILNKKTILMMIFCDYFVIGTYNAFWSFSSLIENGICKPDVVFPDTKHKYRDFLVLGASLVSFIPMTIIMFFTPFIVWKLVQKRQKRQSTQHAGGRSSKNDSREIRASLVLIAVVAAFLLLACPIAIMFNIAFFQNVSIFEVNDLVFFVCREIAQILEQLNYSINFFLYVMCSETFRKRALQLLKCPRKRSTIKPSTTNTDISSCSNQTARTRRSAKTSTVYLSKTDASDGHTNTLQVVDID